MSTKPERASPADEFWGRTASCPRMSAIGGKADTLGMNPNRRVSGGDMELEKARARRSISYT